MRVAYIAAGAANMYCGACTRDLHLIRALIARGVDVQVVPLYTPIRNEMMDQLPLAPVHLGGINAYLQQISPRFARLPAALHRLFDSPALLTWAGQFAVKTDPRQLGAMTLSVLEGEAGRQREEIAQLLAFLQAHVQPDIVCLTNSLLSGLAPAVQARLGVPVLCSLQGEEVFLNAIPEPYRSQAFTRLRTNARAIELFLSPGERYTREMAALLGIPPAKIHLVRAGIDVGLFQHAQPRVRVPFTVGYLSVITPAKGLHLLVEAFARFQQTTRTDIRLQVAGRILDAAYWRAIRSQVQHAGLAERFTFLDEVDFTGKRDFLQQCSVLVMPSHIAESRAMVALEAQAAGIPVIVPDSGIFPEMLALTGGGIVIPPDDPAAIATALARLADDPDYADALGRAGAAGVATHFTAARMAEQMHLTFNELLN